MLLNAYAFGQMGAIAFYGAIVSFAGAAVMLVLSLLGLAHLRRVPAEAEVKLELASSPPSPDPTQHHTKGPSHGSGPSPGVSWAPCLAETAGAPPTGAVVSAATVPRVLTSWSPSHARTSRGRGAC